MRAGRNCGHQRRSRLLTQTDTDPRWEYAHCVTNSGFKSTSQHSRFHPKKTRQGNRTPRLQLSHNIQLRVRAVGDQDAIHVLLRVRHRSRTSPWVPFSQCVAHGNAEVLQTILGTVLRPVGLILIWVLLSLAPSDQFRTKTLIVDSTHSSASFDVTLNSPMMFCPLFAVVQSSEPHCPPCLAWAALTTSSAASKQRLDFLSLSCARTLATLQCRALSLGTSSGCALNPSAPSGHELSTSLACVYTRHLSSPFVTLAQVTIVFTLREILT